MANRLLTISDLEALPGINCSNFTSNTINSIGNPSDTTDVFNSFSYYVGDFVGYQVNALTNFVKDYNDKEYLLPAFYTISCPINTDTLYQEERTAKYTYATTGDYIHKIYSIRSEYNYINIQFDTFTGFPPTLGDFYKGTIKLSLVVGLDHKVWLNNGNTKCPVCGYDFGHIVPDYEYCENCEEDRNTASLNEKYLLFSRIFVVPYNHFNMLQDNHESAGSSGQLWKFNDNCCTVHDSLYRNDHFVIIYYNMEIEDNRFNLHYCEKSFIIGNTYQQSFTPKIFEDRLNFDWYTGSDPYYTPSDGLYNKISAKGSIHQFNGFNMHYGLYGSSITCKIKLTYMQIGDNYDGMNNLYPLNIMVTNGTTLSFPSFSDNNIVQRTINYQFNHSSISKGPIYLQWRFALNYFTNHANIYIKYYIISQSYNGLIPDFYLNDSSKYFIAKHDYGYRTDTDENGNFLIGHSNLYIPGIIPNLNTSYTITIKILGIYISGYFAGMSAPQYYTYNGYNNQTFTISIYNPKNNNYPSYITLTKSDGFYYFDSNWANQFTTLKIYFPFFRNSPTRESQLKNN